MSLLTRIVGASNVRDVDASDFPLAYVDERSGPTHARVNVDQDSALRYVAVNAAVSLIADSIASMPVDHFRRRADGGREPHPQPPPWLMPDAAPNIDTDQYTFVHRTLTSLLLDGNAYTLIIDRDRLGRPAHLVNLHPNRIEPVRSDGTIMFDYTGPDGRPARYSRYGPMNTDGDLLHIKGFDNGHLKALSPIDAAREAVALGMAAEEYGARFFGQGAVPPGLLVIDGQMPSAESLERVSEWFRRNYSGRARAHTPAVVANAKWEQISISPEAAQFLETRKFQTAEIARLYRVPPHLIGDVERSTSWGTGIEEQNRAFLTYTLTPWLRRLEGSFSTLVPRGSFVRFNPAGLLRADIETRYQAYRTAREGGWLNVNEIRALEDLEPVAGGDAYLQPLNYTNLGDPDANDDTVQP